MKRNCMEKIKPLLERSSKKFERSSSASQIEVGQTEPKQRPPSIVGVEESEAGFGSEAVPDRVDAINQISGSTGVTAHSESNKVVLFDSDGDDITVENLQTLANHDKLKVRKIGEAGAFTNDNGSDNWIGA